MNRLDGIVCSAFALCALSAGAAFAQRTSDADSAEHIGDAASAGVYANLQHLLAAMDAIQSGKTGVSHETRQYAQTPAGPHADPCDSHTPADWLTCLEGTEARLAQSNINDSARTSLHQRLTALAQAIRHSDSDQDRATQRAALVSAEDFLAQSAHQSR